MEDSVITIVAIFLAAILMFIFPIMAVSDRVDDISEMSVQTETSEFVDRITNMGCLTLEEYNKYIQTATIGGITPLDVEVQIQILDENPNIEANNENKTKIGKNLYYTIYTKQIEEKLGNEGKIILKEGDIFSVNVRNTNKTLGQMLRNLFYHTNEDTYQIAASDSGVVMVDGNI